MFGLIDCNNFFASCERVFNPSLNDRPVIVLSNNDGCVIARSNEAKLLGIKMAVPFYQIESLVKQYHIAVFSTNFPLYGDMSERVMSTLSNFVPELEVYSIDEAFLYLNAISDHEVFGRELTQKTARWTGIPVSLGIAPTKTLAKIANHFAKKYKGYNQVCCIDTEEKRIKALRLTPINDVWGVGRRLAPKLEAEGIKTAYDLTLKSRNWIRRKMSVVGERTWLELLGVSCIGSDDLQAERQQICTSRSFGQPICTYTNLLEAIATLASLCVEKLRRQKTMTKAIYLFIQTNRFKEDSYRPAKMIQLPFHTASETEIIGYCRQALETIYIDKIEYKRAGVILMDILPEEFVQKDLFDPIDREKQRRLTKAVDHIIQRNGRHSIQVATQGNGYKANIRQEYLSRRYTTNLNEIIEIHV